MMRKTMRRMVHAVCLAVLLVVFGMPAVVYGAEEGSTSAASWTDYAADSFAGGDGSEADPYQISSAEQLAKLSKDVSEGEAYNGVYFKLTGDIDLAGHIWVPIGIYMLSENEVMTSEPFRGSLDGDGHTIHNMAVDQRADRHAGGLFGNVGNADAVDNEIRNLIVKDARIDNRSGRDLFRSVNGILAAYVMAGEGHTVKFTNVETSGVIRVEGRSRYEQDINGGMLGIATRVTVKNCHVRHIDISGAEGVDNTGGFVGIDQGSSYEDCTASGIIDGAWTMGGFVGCTDTAIYEDADTAGSFKHCMAEVEVHASAWNSGGFAAYADCTIFSNCVAKGDVTSTVAHGPSKIGGFVGSYDKGKVSNCHAGGKLILASPSVGKPGGFVGSRRLGIYSDNSFDSEKNPGIKATYDNKDMQDVEGVEGVSTQAVKANICRDYDGKHQIEEVAKIDATCTEDGIDGYYICNACGTMYADADQKNILQEVPVRKAQGHKLSAVAKKDATCTEDGIDGYYICENCGILYADADQKNIIQEVPVIKATGHSFGEWKITKEPTTEAEGTEARVCENCQYAETRSVEKLKSEHREDASRDANDNVSNDVSKDVTKAAKTGDESRIRFTLALMMAAVAAGCIAIIRRKTDHEELSE